MTDTLNDMDERAVAAGELALRVLSDLEEAQARARVRSDPAFAAEVDAWNERLAAFVADVAPVAPSDGVWSRIQAATASAVSANDNGRLAFWKTWAIGATTLLAASLGAVAFMIAQPEPVAPAASAPLAPTGGVTRVATLALESGEPVLTLAYDSVTGNLFIAPTPELSGEAGVPHLWLVRPEGGVQLIGAIAEDSSSRLTLNQVLTGVAGQATAVAVSIEAPGTTPASDTPAGPVVASGELQRL